MYKGPIFTLELLLKTEMYQRDKLNKHFNIGRIMYNYLAGKMLNKYNQMKKTKRYRKLQNLIINDKSNRKEYYKQLVELYNEFGLNKYNFEKEIKEIQHHFNKCIDSTVAQKIANEVWSAFDKLLFSNGKFIHFKKYGTFNTLEGKSTVSGIKYKKGNNYIKWMGMKFPFILKTKYEKDALENEVSYCRIVRKEIRGKYKYYVQFVLRGIPPLKNRTLGHGDLGIDIGTSTIAIASENLVKIQELATKSQGLECKKQRILRKMDRSKRATNPHNYNSDGTIKSGRLKWNYSNHYKKLKSKLKEIYRKQAVIRKYEHEVLANEIIKNGDTFFIEEMNFKALQKRSKETKRNVKGKYLSKKRFGKSLGNRAPSMLVDIIRRKLNNFGVELTEINTREARASQFNHFDETYKKKKLSQRWNNFNGIKVQRDLYSAFLIMNIDKDLKNFDLDKCNERFDNFKKLHDLEVQRLSGNKNLSSISI